MLKSDMLNMSTLTTQSEMLLLHRSGNSKFWSIFNLLAMQISQLASMTGRIKKTEIMSWLEIRSYMRPARHVQMPAQVKRHLLRWRKKYTPQQSHENRARQITHPSYLPPSLLSLPYSRPIETEREREG